MNKKILSAILACTLFGLTVFSESESPAPSKSPNAAVTGSATASPSKSSISPSPSASAASASPKTTAPSASPQAQASSSDSEANKNIFPEPHSEAAIVINRKTGEILYEKNKSEKLYPASTTKIMTAILALENGTLSDLVTATAEAISPITNQHSHMGLKINETLTLEQLLYGMLVYSANDAANVIAVHIGGNLGSFTEMMNAKAAQLGLTGTHYQNAHGFHDDNHYTTAEDLAKLTQYAMQNEKFCEIVSTPLYRIPADDLYTEERVLSTTNHLISRYRNPNYFYRYAIGVKTGYTDEAGNCLVSAATKGDIELISVILKAENSPDQTLYAFADTAALFEYVFNNYKYCKIASTDQVISDSAVYEAKRGVRVALSPAENLETLLPVNTNTDDIVPEITLNEKIQAPIAKGDVLGHVTYTYLGKMLAETDLIAANDVEHDKIIATINLIMHIITHPLFLLAAVIIIILIISSKSKKNKRRRKRQIKLKYSKR